MVVGYYLSDGFGIQALIEPEPRPLRGWPTTETSDTGSSVPAKDHACLTSGRSCELMYMARADRGMRGPFVGPTQGCRVRHNADVSALGRVVDLILRGVAGLGVVAALLWGLSTARLVLDGGGVASWLGAAGILLLVTPVAMTIAGSVNYAFASLLLRPLRRLLQTDRDPGSLPVPEN